MRTRIVSYEGRKSLMVYLAEEEREQLKDLLPEWKKEYKNIALFLSGERDAEKTLGQIIESHGG